MVLGIGIGIFLLYLIIGILFAMYLVKRNIKENNGRFDNSCDNAAGVTIAFASLFWPFGMPTYAIIRLFGWWVNYNEKRYLKEEKNKDKEYECICLGEISGCILLDKDGKHCNKESNHFCEYSQNVQKHVRR